LQQCFDQIECLLVTLSQALMHLRKIYGSLNIYINTTPRLQTPHSAASNLCEKAN